jgi:hypothetical protein
MKNLGNDRDPMILQEGSKEVTYNLEDALEVLSTEEAVILDMLVSKVHDHSHKKAIMHSQSKSAMLSQIAKSLGLEIVQMQKSIDPNLYSLADLIGPLKVNPILSPEDIVSKLKEQPFFGAMEIHFPEDPFGKK